MTNSDYITINEHGVFVGGEPATTYRGKEIFNIKSTLEYFSEIKTKIKQEQNLDLSELHVLSSKTYGDKKTGNPSSEHGRYAWCRAKLEDGTELAWNFIIGHVNADKCAVNCAYVCASRVLVFLNFRRVFRSATKNDSHNAQNENFAIQQNDEIGKVIEMDFGNRIIQAKIIAIKQKQI